MKDLGKAQKVLGISIRQKKGMVKLDEVSYISDVLNRFNMKDCKGVATPISTGQMLKKPEKKNYLPENVPYQELGGCLMYLAVCMRPDIVHTVHILSQFNNCYSLEHWQAANCVLRYL